MLQGLEIMLERMRTHPEEFVASNKYTRAYHRVKPFLTEEEREAVTNTLVEAHRTYFNGEILTIMSGEEEKQLRVSTYDESSFTSVALGTDKSYENQAASAILRGMNTLTKPSAFGAVPISAEGTYTTFESKM